MKQYVSKFVCQINNVKINNKGPSIDPFGNPHTIAAQHENASQFLHCDTDLRDVNKTNQGQPL